MKHPEWISHIINDIIDDISDCYCNDIIKNNTFRNRRQDPYKPEFSLENYFLKNGFDIIRSYQLQPLNKKHKYSIIQLKVYQQFTPNLCGYHAIFNAIECSKILIT